MIKGYAINKKRLEYLEETINLINIPGRFDRKLQGTGIKRNYKNSK